MKEVILGFREGLHEDKAASCLGLQEEWAVLLCEDCSKGTWIIHVGG